MPWRFSHRSAFVPWSRGTAGAISTRFPRNGKYLRTAYLTHLRPVPRDDSTLANLPCKADGALSAWCALGVQEGLARNVAPEAKEGPLRLRIGITLGDIIIQDDGDIFGEGVNVATRLEQFAEPGGICVSGKVHDEVESKIAVPWEEHGEYQVKNISRPVRVFAAPRSRGATPAGATASAAHERTAALVRIDHKRRVAAAIRDYLARERISREQFALKTKLGKSTVEKLLVGLFSERTLAIVESHTGLRLREMLESPVTDDTGPAPPAAAGAKALDRPSLAVLPFTNMSGDTEQEYLADGITEDLITALARLRWLFVIARNSSFTYKSKAGDVRQIAQELGVGLAHEPGRQLCRLLHDGPRPRASWRGTVRGGAAVPSRLHHRVRACGPIP